MALVKSLTGSYVLGFILLAAVGVVCLLVLTSLERRPREPAPTKRVARPGTASPGAN